MGLSIDVRRVKEVLLADGKWRDVVSFELDAYEFEVGNDTVQDAHMTTTGARFVEGNGGTEQREAFCPLSAIQAVSYGWTRKAPAGAPSAGGTGRTVPDDF